VSKRKTTSLYSRATNARHAQRRIDYLAAKGITLEPTRRSDAAAENRSLEGKDALADLHRRRARNKAIAKRRSDQDQRRLLGDEGKYIRDQNRRRRGLEAE
jgi:hypothetical protein